MSKNKKVRISNGSINCYGSRVITSGIDYSQYERNPILLWMHKRGDIGCVIGRVENINVEGDDLTGDLVFDGIGETAQLAQQKWEAGTLRAVSANLNIIELSDAPEYVLPGQTAYTATRSKLTEVSVVDMGGNDDALVMLQYEGKSIALSSDGNNKMLPLLQLSKDKAEINIKLENEMKDLLKKQALALGLPETATETEVMEAIALALGYKSKVVELEDGMKVIELANITTMVEGAILARKFGADKKEHFVALGQKVGAETLKLTLDSMSATMKPTDLTGANAQFAKADAGEYKKLSEVPADKIMLMRKDDKETYMKLYKAEYGIECDLK